MLVRKGQGPGGAVSNPEVRAHLGVNSGGRSISPRGARWPDDTATGSGVKKTWLTPHGCVTLGGGLVPVPQFLLL